MLDSVSESVEIYDSKVCRLKIGVNSKDGSVNVPVALRPYMGGKEKLVPVK